MTTAETKTSTPAAIRPCTCRHPQQDALHGTGMRVCNYCPPTTKTTTPVYRCTVCGAQHA